MKTVKKVILVLILILNQKNIKAQIKVDLTNTRIITSDSIKPFQKLDSILNLYQKYPKADLSNTKIITYDTTNINNFRVSDGKTGSHLSQMKIKDLNKQKIYKFIINTPRKYYNVVTIETHYITYNNKIVITYKSGKIAIDNRNSDSIKEEVVPVNFDYEVYYKVKSAITFYNKITPIPTILNSIISTSTITDGANGANGSSGERPFNDTIVSTYDSISSIKNNISIKNDIILSKRNELSLNEDENTKDSHIITPFKITGQYIVLSLNLKKYTQKEGYNIETIPVVDSVLPEKITFYARNYLKLSFSTGFFGNTLSNPNYYFTDTKGTVRQEKTEHIVGPFVDVAIGALAHLQYVIYSWIKIGPVLGVALSPLDAKTRYLIGGSFTFGRKNEISISYGVAGAALAQPSSSTSTVVSLSNTLTTVPTYNKFTTGEFIGLSWNIIN